MLAGHSFAPLLGDKFPLSSQRKIAEMRKAWGDGKHVRVIHPNSGCIVGKEQVSEGLGEPEKSGEN